MNLRNLFKRKSQADGAVIERELEKAEVVPDPPKPVGKVHKHTKRPSWSLDKPQGGGVRRNMPKGLQKLKDNIDG